MINIDLVKFFHNILIDQFGGSKGLRDHKALEAALSRPFTTFDGKDLYPSIIEKSAALVESLVKNHAFIDGNKRIGYVMMRFYLLENGFEITASQKERYSFIIDISKGKLSFIQIKDWIEKNVTKVD